MAEPRYRVCWHRFLCRIGWHDWTGGDRIINGSRWRHCTRCQQRQVGDYDMLYGSTWWRNI
jgi:hypothetical protein